MSLDPRTMLFSIFVVYALSVISMYVAVTSKRVGIKQDGMRKWALAI